MRSQDYLPLGQVKLKKQQGKKLFVGLDPLFSASLKPSRIFVHAHHTYIPYLVQGWELLADQRAALVELDGIEDGKQLLGKELFVIAQEVSTEAKSVDVPWIGYEVHDEKEGLLGLLEEIIPRQGQPLLSIRYQDASLWVPLHTKIVVQVDHHSQTIRVCLPDGYLAEMLPSFSYRKKGT